MNDNWLITSELLVSICSSLKVISEILRQTKDPYQKKTWYIHTFVFSLVHTATLGEHHVAYMLICVLAHLKVSVFCIYFFSLDQFSYESNEVDQKNVLFFFVFLMHGIHIVECEQHSPWSSPTHKPTHYAAFCLAGPQGMSLVFALVTD